MNEALWDLIELDDTTINYFINGKTKPALSIGQGVFSPRKRATVYFGQGIITEPYSSIKLAKERALEILSKTTKPITVRIVEPRKKEKYIDLEVRKDE